MKAHLVGAYNEIIVLVLRIFLEIVQAEGGTSKPLLRCRMRKVYILFKLSHTTSTTNTTVLTVAQNKI